MKKLLLFFVLLIPFLVNGEVPYAISHDQYYVIPENVGQDWLVGQFHANVSDTMIHVRSGSYSFSIVSGNTGSAFAINSSTGMISVSDSTVFLGNGDDDYTLGIQVSIDSETETRNAYIHVVDKDNCKFIDMDSGSSGNSGSRYSPYSEFADIDTLTAGHAAFLKRGTTGGFDENVHVSELGFYDATFTAASPFYVGAYGTSTVKPKIDSNSSSAGVGVQIGWTETIIPGELYVKHPCPHVNVYDIVAVDFVSSGGDGNCFKISDSTKYVQLNRCEGSNGGYNGEFYGTSYSQVSMRDCKATNNSWSHNMKFQGSYDTIISCYAKTPRSTKTCFSFPGNSTSTHDIVCYSYAGGGGSQGITLRKSYSEAAFNYCAASYNCILVHEGDTNEVANYNSIHHNRCVVSTNCRGIVLQEGSNTSVYNNIVVGASSNSETKGIYLIGDEGGSVIHNNTVLKTTIDIIKISAYDAEFRNNIYQTISGSFSPNTNNYDYDDGDPFVSYSNNDFHLDSIDALDLIDEGYSYGTSEDIDNVSIPQYGGWDIGAYEHPGESAPADTIVSITKISDAYEQNEAAGTFRVSRTGSTSGALTVNLGTPGGTATLNTDYTISHSGSITISSGNSYADITVSPDDDSSVEGTETVTLSITSGSGYTLGTYSASMNLYDYEPGTLTMLAHWPFEEGSGTSAEDVTENSHDGTLTNGASFSGDAEVGSYSVLLDGDDDYVGAGTIDLGSEFTICMWVKIPTSGVSSIQALCTNSSSGSTTDGMRIFVNTYGTTDQKIIVETANGSTSDVASTSTGTFDFDQWNHVAFAVDKTNGKCRIYYNGDVATTDSTIRTDFATNQTFHLGQMTNNSYTMKGNLDDVRIYDSFLTEAEVDEIITGEALPTVTITATDATATEASQTTGTYRISRGSETSGDLTVNFSKSGTATYTTDYSLSSSSSVVISDGNTYADVTLTPVDDSTVESDETAILTISSSANYTIGSPSSATVTIVSDDIPTVTILATDTLATEAGTTTGTYRISRGSETSGNLTVNFSRSGTATYTTDYSLSSSSSVTISDGNTYAEVTLTPVDDSAIETNETAILTITSGSYTIGSPSSATVTIVSDDTEGSYDDMIAYWPFEEGSGTSAEDVTDNSHDGTLTNGASFSGDAEVGSYSVLLDGDDDYVGTGTIDLGSEFTICMWVKIPTSGVSSIQALCANSSSGSTTDGMRIFVNTYGTTDQKIIVETANGSTSDVASTSTGAFDFDQWNHVAFAVDKTNGKCRIYYNGDVATTDSTIRTDFATNQTFHLGQMTNNSYTMKGNLDDVRIYDSFLTEAEVDEIITGEALPTVTITATDATATEASQTTGTYRISRGSETSGDLTVNFSKSGTATYTTDYSLSSSSSVTISDGNTYAEVTLTPVDDSTVESDETAILTISSSANYTIGSPSSATVTIVSDDVPTVTISATDTLATEAGTTTGTYQISRGSETSGNLTVNFSRSGTATYTTDYSLSSSSSVTISDGNTYAEVTLTPVDDSTIETDETAILTITSGSYTIGSPSSATVTIVSDDTEGSYDDPIAHWKFEQNGDDEYDTYDLTYSEDMTSYYYNSTPPSVSFGYYVSFNNGRYAYTPTINLGNEFTLTGWYKTSAGGYPTLLTNATSSANGFCLRVNNSYDRIELRTENSTNDELIATSNNSTHTDATWVHFAAVVDRSSGTCDLYVDGEDETNSSSIRTDFKNSDPIYLAIVPAADYKLYGNMDDVRIYDYLVDADDIADIYAGTKNAHVSLDGESSPLSVFPVPFTDVFTVKGAADVKRIEVMNICGKSILVKDNPGNPVFKVNMSGQPAGYYIMRVIDNNNDISIQKLIKK